MFSGLSAKMGKPDFPALPIFVAAPFIVAGVVVTVIGIAAKNPKRSAQQVGAGAVLIILGDLLIFGLRAAIV
jgi:hypothetical protein